MKILGLAAAALLITSTGAFAQESEDDQAAMQEKKICKTKKLTGSLTRVRRTCLTRAEWSRLAEGTRANVVLLERDANQKESICLRNGSQNC